MASPPFFSRFTGQVTTNLAANVIQGLLGIVLIPFATRVLGPEDYGVYGMAIVVAGLVAALCETGAAYVLYGHIHDLVGAERKKLISTLLLLTAAIGTLAAIALWALWPIASGFNKLLGSMTRLEIGLICIVIPCRTVWAIANPILIALMRSTWLAASILFQTVASFAAVLLALYTFDQGRASLFWGVAAGAVAGNGLAFYAIGRDALAIPAMKWFRGVVGVAPAAWLAGLLDNARSTVESGTVAAATGSAGLGVYNHGKLYQGILMQAANAFANVIWPVALQDAKAKSPEFLRVRLAWNVVYLCLTLAGVVFVFLGEDIVHLLTHGKFDSAAPWIPFFIIYLLIQNSGKPSTAVLYATHQGNLYSALRIGTTSVAIVGFLLLVPVYGIPAAIATGIAEMTLFRVLIQIYARRTQATPFLDQWVLLGIFVIGICWLLAHITVPGEPARWGMCAFMSVALLALANRSLVVWSQKGALGHLRALLGR